MVCGENEVYRRGNLHRFGFQVGDFEFMAEILVHAKVSGRVIRLHNCIDRTAHESHQVRHFRANRPKSVDSSNPSERLKSGRYLGLSVVKV